MVKRTHTMSPDALDPTQTLVNVPPAAMTYILVLIGTFSSIAADAGCLMPIPLAAAASLSLGRHPLAGLAASFAGVAAVSTAKIPIDLPDGMLTGIGPRRDDR